MASCAEWEEEEEGGGYVGNGIDDDDGGGDGNYYMDDDGVDGYCQSWADIKVGGSNLPIGLRPMNPPLSPLANL